MNERTERLAEEMARKMFAANSIITIPKLPSVANDPESGGKWVEARVFVPDESIKHGDSISDADLVSVEDGIVTAEIVLDGRTVDIKLDLTTQREELLDALGSSCEVELIDRDESFGKSKEAE